VATRWRVVNSYEHLVLGNCQAFTGRSVYLTFNWPTAHQQKLELNEKKTERRFFTQDAAGLLQCTDEHGKPAPLQYLGLEFTGQIIQLRSSSLARHHQRMRRGVRKAVCMAKGRKGQQGGKVFKRALYRKFSHLGKFNFVKYAKRAYHITGSSAILKTGAGQR